MRRAGVMRCIVLGMFAALAASACTAGEPLKVGSKRFTESYILGEIVAQTAQGARVPVVHKPGMGATGILFAAVKSGAIDVYPEYTGTIAFELLKDRSATDLAAINRALAPLGLGAGVPLGFNNSYALAMLEADAERLGIVSLSDLARHPRLRFGLSQEFLNRADGWPVLRSAYRFGFEPAGLDHGLAYEALAAGQIDAIDVYTTDAKRARYRLRVLADDRGVFPRYDAVLVYRLDLGARFPAAWSALQKLEGRISTQRMVALNAQAELDGKPFAAVARDFLSGADDAPAAGARAGFLQLLFGADFWRLTGQHLLLVFVSLAFAVAGGIPLGIAAARDPGVARTVLAIVGVVQTVPSLALLAFLIPLLGTIGTLPALLALFLYSLLPIVRNTYSGLLDIPAALQEAARALGLPATARLRLIELPLAARSILSGVKTSAVVNVGTATIAAFIGAGGYGERIASGLALNDNAVLLAGAVPAAGLALLVEALFSQLDRRLISAGLQSPGPDR